VRVVRERVGTADKRVIKAELHPLHRAERRVTIRPSMLLLMTWALQLSRHVSVLMLRRVQQYW